MSIQKLNKDEEAIIRMAQTDGWDAMRIFIAKQKDTLTRQLTIQKFNSLDEVSSLQGEIRAYDKVLGHVNNCLKKMQEV